MAKYQLIVRQEKLDKWASILKAKDSRLGINGELARARTFLTPEEHAALSCYADYLKDQLPEQQTRVEQTPLDARDLRS